VVKSAFVTGFWSIQKGGKVNRVAFPLVVVSCRPIVGSDFDGSAGEVHHGTASPSKPSVRIAQRPFEPYGGRIGPAPLELKRLQHGLVVLVFVLKHHLIHEPVPKEGVGGVKVVGGKPLEHFSPNLVHYRPALVDSGQAKGTPLTPGMFERIEEARHFNELDWPVQVTGEPKFLKVRYVPKIPEDRAHQRIVLGVQLVLRQRSYKQEGSGSGLEQLPGNGTGINPAGSGDRGHGISVLTAPRVWRELYN